MGGECCGSICKLFEGAHDAPALGMTNAPHLLLQVDLTCCNDGLSHYEQWPILKALKDLSKGEVVVMGREGLSRGGLDVDCLASGGKDGSIPVALSCMGET
eukprot:4451494-Ditylum_brightwellii.AAC.1